MRTQPHFFLPRPERKSPLFFGAQAPLIRNDTERKQEKVEKDVSTPRSKSFDPLDEGRRKIYSTGRDKFNSF